MSQEIPPSSRTTSPSAPGRAPVPAAGPRDGFITPRHGHGALRPILPGQVLGARGNTAVRAVRILAKQKSAEVCQRLIEIALEDQDTRVAVVACQQVRTWAFGKPENLKAEDGEAKPVLDVSKLSGKELQTLLKALHAGRVADQVTPADATEHGGD